MYPVNRAIIKRLFLVHTDLHYWSEISINVVLQIVISCQHTFLSLIFSFGKYCIGSYINIIETYYKHN